MTKIEKASTYVREHRLEKYIGALLQYWADNPPTLGHGFSHAIDVAITAVELGDLNSYKDTESLFLGGLFHDVYRPAQAKDGEEDQTLGAEVVINICTELNTPQNTIDLIVGAIRSHDSWRKDQSPPLYDLLISVADKINLTASRSYSYLWSSNQFLINHGKQPKYTNHLDGHYAFVRYQARAWEIFAAFNKRIQGVHLAIESYLQMYHVFSQNLLNDPDSNNYFSCIEDYARTSLTEENRALHHFTAEKAVIEMITSDAETLKTKT